MRMNIKYGDDNYLVRYLQAFLQEYYNKSFRVSGIYDEYTHSNLIEYLKLPNVMSLEYVHSALEERYPGLFIYFIYYSGSDNIDFISKSVSDETAEYMDSIKEDLNNYVVTLGWKLDEFTNYQILSKDKFKISLSSTGRENRFPNRDLLCMVNLFMNKYLYDYIITTIGNDGSISYNTDRDTNYKLAIVSDCDPDSYYTICHAYENAINLVIASSPYDSNSDLSVNNNVSNVETIYLDSGSLYTYKTSSDCKSIVIQMQYGGLLSNTFTISVPIRIGDINLDGKIDDTDLDLLRQYRSSQNTANPVVFSMAQKYASLIDLTNNPVKDDKGNIISVSNLSKPEYSKYVDSREISEYDVAKLSQYITGTNSTSLGIINYPNVVEANSVSENILMVTKGYFTNDSASQHMAEDYFPSVGYSKSPWMVNDKLLNYILDRSITPYSDEEDILYLQELLVELFTSTKYEYMGVYSDEMIELVRNYQISKGITFHTGYLDVETEALMIIDINNIGSASSTATKYEYVLFDTGYGDYLSIDIVPQGEVEDYLAVGRIEVK